MQQKQQINIPLEQTTPVVCDNCEGTAFCEALILRKASKFLTGSPQDSLVPISTFYCVKCGHVNDEFKPKELTKETED
jgi:predicted nucleic-acid-binding Zn-ribbon protein